MADQTLKERFAQLDGYRKAKLDKARQCASLTLPEEMPPSGWVGDYPLPMPLNSAGTQGVLHLSSQIHNTMLPAGDDVVPFAVRNRNGVGEDAEVREMFVKTVRQIKTKLDGTNFRSATGQAITRLVVVGDTLLHMSDDFQFHTTRVDQYVVQREVNGDWFEVVWLEYRLKDPTEIAEPSNIPEGDRSGYVKIWGCVMRTDRNTWKRFYQDDDGDPVGEVENFMYAPPCNPLRWRKVDGDNWGTSYVEHLAGDLTTHSGATHAMLEGMAASVVYWMALDPHGPTQLEDVAGRQSGTWIQARKADVGVISPAAELQAQVAASQNAEQLYRREIGQMFMRASSVLPTGDRVTAAAVRMVTAELDATTGGSPSILAQDILEWVVRRTIARMVELGELDTAFAEHCFDDDGELTIEITTGLQALTRDADLSKMLQIIEVFTRLPEQVQATLKWNVISRRIFLSLGFAPEEFVKSEQEMQQEAQQRQAMEMQQQLQAQAGQAAIGTAQAAAEADIQNTGGAGIQQAVGQLPPSITQQ